MSLKIKLALIIVVMVAAVIAVLSVITLRRNSQLQMETTYRYAGMQAEANSIEIQRRIEIFADYGIILAELISEFEGTEENQRRVKYNDILLDIIEQNDRILGIWTAWLPGAIDRRDAELGQYQTFFTRRRTGSVEHVREGYEGWQTYLADMNGKAIIASPVWREIHGYGNVGIVSVLYPIKNKSKKQVGILGVNFVSDMQEIADELKEKIYEGKGMAGVYANDGVIVAHYDRNRIADNIAANRAEMNLLGKDLNRVAQAIRNGGENGKPVILHRFSEDFASDMYIIYQPVKITGMDTPWCLMIAIPIKEITRPVREMTLFTVIFALIILTVTAVITFFIARGIVKPIIGVTRTLKDISEGEGDLTRRIESKSRDEVGELSLYFNNTLEKIRNLVIIIKKEATVLSGVGSDLASNMTETAAAVNEITSSIRNIKGLAINQSASVSETNATMKQLTENINSLGAHVEKQSNNVSQASAAIEEMVANIRMVTETLIKNSANVDTLRDASEVGRNGIEEVAGDIQEIARESEGLSEINSVMENIASQTNLLSMNAAIEAAHAGDAGRGFAVVADEIRKLAESSGVQSKTISLVLKKIKTSIDKITMSTGNVLKEFEAIDSGVKTVAEQEDSIRNAMKEQETGSRQILEVVGNVTGITGQVKNGSQEMLAGAKEVILESNNLEGMTQEISSGMNEMAAGAEQISTAVNHVNDISAKNNEGINSLMKEVSRFKV